MCDTRYDDFRYLCVPISYAIGPDVVEHSSGEPLGYRTFQLRLAAMTMRILSVDLIDLQSCNTQVK